MTEFAALESYAAHSALTHPGSHGALIGGLPLDIPVLCRTLHGLLIHEAWVEKRGLSPAIFSGQSRATLSVAQRLEQLLPIDASRPSRGRSGPAGTSH